MFLRKDIKKVKTGNQIVPFCNDCNSQDIETIQVCRKCGSHNTKVDWTDDRSAKSIYEDKEIHVYRCDRCGKEFDGFKTDNFITYTDCGEFVPYKPEYDYGASGTNYSLDIDLCKECKKLIVDRLNKELDEVAKREHVMEIVEEVITDGGK